MEVTACCLLLWVHHFSYLDGKSREGNNSPTFVTYAGCSVGTQRQGLWPLPLLGNLGEERRACVRSREFLLKLDLHVLDFKRKKKKKRNRESPRPLGGRNAWQKLPELHAQRLMLPAVMLSLYSNTGRHPGLAGNLQEEEEEEDGDDYENTAPPYKDLPPKPGSLAPPRPPKAGNKVENPPLPLKPPKTTALDLPAVTCTPLPSGVNFREPPSFLSSITTSAPPTPVPWISQKSGGSGCRREDRWLVFLCLLVVTSLLLSGVSLTVALLKLTGMVGLAGLKKDIDRVRADMNQSLVELQGLLKCTRVTCPDNWLPFESKCYYFSPSTKSWDNARKFCQENYSHLVIIDSLAEHNFVATAHGSSRTYWLGLNDKEREGDWRWLDGSPVTLSFWEPQEPNNNLGEDCASMNKGGTWNDLSCTKTTYWICERKCSC
ncbi:PREDICTED: C-type lectin domain family 17, member A isoform X2 [Chinchilla lanigera]|uniref:C-type lectin domain family 17, member A isoform X2 n=1 Tax=Chinchilla lanigera TaxID=34839 RepID=UPI0006964973|nr:PREDICTED: C-type lectin domain family 17, member A isoform X2 [Chinchilla lanigera]